MALETMPSIDRLAFELQIDGCLLATNQITHAQPNKGHASTDKESGFLVHSKRVVVDGGLIDGFEQVTLLFSLSLVEQSLVKPTKNQTMQSDLPNPSAIPPRDAHQRGLQRIMTMGGEFGTRNYTVKHLRDLKGKRVLTETMPFTTDEARAAQEAGIDTLKVKFDPKNPASAIALRKAAPNTFMTYCIGLTKVATVQEAVRAGFDAMESGADGIMCQWGPEFIQAVSKVGIPVQAHAGLVPRLSTWTGGLRAVGKTLEEAMWIFEQIKTFEQAGAWAVEVEVVPAELLKQISCRTGLVVSSIGAGSGGDIQFMFAEDILGNHAPPYPRHTKQYRDLYAMEQAIQAERVGGFRDFIDDVKSGKFPGPEHVVKAPTGLIDEFLSRIEGR
jgi:3-methyl-2-oxobutanoate hydroxymethyltransferase